MMASKPMGRCHELLTQIFRGSKNQEEGTLSRTKAIGFKLSSEVSELIPSSVERQSQQIHGRARLLVASSEKPWLVSAVVRRRPPLFAVSVLGASRPQSACVAVPDARYRPCVCRLRCPLRKPYAWGGGGGGGGRGRGVYVRRPPPRLTSGLVHVWLSLDLVPPPVCGHPPFGGVSTAPLRSSYPLPPSLAPTPASQPASDRPFGQSLGVHGLPRPCCFLPIVDGGPTGGRSPEEQSVPIIPGGTLLPLFFVVAVGRGGSPSPASQCLVCGRAPRSAQPLLASRAWVEPPCASIASDGGGAGCISCCVGLTPSLSD